MIYSPKDKHIYMEMSDGADQRDIPMHFAPSYKRGVRTIDSNLSLMWVKARIVPSDRQNIGYILKDLRMEYYDEFKLLTYNKGLSSQDDYYIEEVLCEEIPDFLKQRLTTRVVEVAPLSDMRALVFFVDGRCKLCDLSLKPEVDPKFTPIKNERLFNSVFVQHEGYAISWGENLEILYPELYKRGIDLPLKLKDFRNFVSYRVVDTAEAARMLNCTVQNINDKKIRNTLTPVKASPKYSLFLKGDVERC